MNPSPAEKPSLVERLRSQYENTASLDAIGPVGRSLMNEAAAELTRLAGELARVEGERDALKGAAEAVLQHLMRCLESEATVGVPFMGDDEHAAIRVLKTALAQAARTEVDRG